MRVVGSLLLAFAAGSLVACSGGKTMEESSMPFAGEDSVKYATQLWDALQDAGMIGASAVISKPYKGQHPHGAVLDTIEGPVKVGGHTGVAIVKRNYGGDNVSTASVASDPNAYLKAITVMYKRENGYDSDNQDWFWAKFLADGSLDKNPAGMQLAGRVAKGKPAGCIACHTAAPGGDMVFNHNRY
ncbi:MAG: cytochrome P460 family protein [Gammaproteobacteria bacterium]|nr:cytochrome P460 family protein [Gammaproteobacteria bacterium]